MAAETTAGATDYTIPPNARRTRVCVLYRERFLRAIFIDGASVTLDDAREGVAGLRQILGPGASLPLTVDLRRIRSQSSEARAHFSSPECISLSPAVAIIIGSPLSRAIGNFYLGFNRPKIPTRLFSDFATADEWLESFLPRLERVVA